VTDAKGGVVSFRWSPDGKDIAYVATDPVPDEREKKAKRKDDARVVDDEIKRDRLYVTNVASAAGKREGRELTCGNYHILGQDGPGFDWSPDGRAIVFAHAPTSKADDWTAGDIAVVETGSGKIRPLAHTRRAEYSPYYAPDGRQIAYVATDDPPTWAFDSAIYVMPAEGGTPRKLADSFDHRPELLGWSADGRQLWFRENRGTTTRLYRLPLEGTPEAQGFDEGVVSEASLNPTRSAIGFSYQTASRPVEAYFLDADHPRPVKASAANGDLPKKPLGRTEEVRWKSEDGKEIEGLLTYPVGYQSGKKYPLLLIIHGGPAGVFTRTFIASCVVATSGGRHATSAYPVAAFASSGYAVLRCNVRGSSGYGKDFRYSNLNDWGGGDFRDLIAGVDHLIAKGIADPARLGVMGWSYGGYMTAWVIGHTRRFKAASVGAGVTDLVSFPGTADIASFLPSYFGGEPWDQAHAYRDRSPINHIKGASTPTLIQHGEDDERVPIGQGYELYSALKRQDCPVTMVVYPRSHHAIQEPKLLRDAMVRNLEWFDSQIRGRPSSGEARSPSRPLPLMVEKTQDLNSRNEPVRLRGVNTASLEWTSNGEGHIRETIATAIKDWHVNIIRLPLAQDRWFGKAPEQNDAGRSYRALVQEIVDLCRANGCYVILDLHWSDAGQWGKEIGQHVMPDQNSLEFWKSCASEYSNHPGVIFDLYNEPHDVSWEIWQHGGQVTENARRRNPERTFQAVGMQALLDAVRATGAKNVVIAGGLDWSYDMSGFLEKRQLVDRTGNGVIYSNHTYPFKGDSIQRWIAKLQRASEVIPVIVSEFGAESQSGVHASGPSPEQWVRQVLQALEDHGWAWTAWNLHPRAGPRLVSDWKYTPTPTYGKWVKVALAGTLPRSTPEPSAGPPHAQAGGSASSTSVGIFEHHGDVGSVGHPGNAAYDDARRTYNITGSGANMWANRDEFQYVWKKASGDLALTADVAFSGAGKEPHRKACLVIRQGLETDSAYVDVALHGDGLTSLQFRESPGAATHEVQAKIRAPRRLRIEKRGKYVLMFLASERRELAFSGAAVRMTFQEPFYIGLGVCAHTNDVTETAQFSNVELSAFRPSSPARGRPVLHSSLEIMTMSSHDRRVVHVTDSRIEAPNWLLDGQTLLFNSGGRIWSLKAGGGTPKLIDTGFATRCNNDHGVSPDGTLLALSDQSQGRRQSLIYTLPVSGGMPRLITPNGPSYWHGWSPDGKTLAFCGERAGEFDIYTIPASGGQETRLTTAGGLDDGPEFAPEGRSIYFNSVRTGTMQIWRMNTDGSGQEQVTSDLYNNWLPHISPDGRRMVFLSYEKDVVGHPENKDVTLRMMSLASKQIEVLGRFLGGQGTINVPCWSPDGRQIAFVNYQLVP
jgi:dipeptidyl aminopeptidase/acylaminoacyl peptidase